MFKRRPLEGEASKKGWERDTQILVEGEEHWAWSKGARWRSPLCLAMTLFPSRGSDSAGLEWGLEEAQEGYLPSMQLPACPTRTLPQHILDHAGNRKLGEEGA